MRARLGLGVDLPPDRPGVSAGSGAIRPARGLVPAWSMPVGARHGSGAEACSSAGIQVLLRVGVQMYHNVLHSST